VDTVVVTPVDPVIIFTSAGQTYQFSAAAVYSDNSSDNITRAATWSSSGTWIATVNNGLVTLSRAGTVKISAWYQGKSGSSWLQVDVPIPPPPPPPPSGGGSGGGGGVTVPSSKTSLAQYIDANGIFIEDVTATSVDGLAYIVFLAGQTAKDPNGQPLRFVTIKAETSPPEPIANCKFLGEVYDFGPDGATVDPWASLGFRYSESKIPEGVAEENLVIATWQDDKWVELECTVLEDTNYIYTTTDHLSFYAVLAGNRPASFEVDGLTVTPFEVQPNASVKVSVNVTNTGDLTGDYIVALKLNNVDEQSKVITLIGGESQLVSFAIFQDAAGAYTVTIGGLSGEFTVMEPESATEPEGAVAAVPIPELEPTPEPQPQTEEEPIPTAQPEPVTELELPSAPQEEPIPSNGISWWLIFIYAAAGIGVVGLVTIIVRGKRRH
jgi:hypothetical protein